MPKFAWHHVAPHAYVLCCDMVPCSADNGSRSGDEASLRVCQAYKHELHANYVMAGLDVAVVLACALCSCNQTIKPHGPPSSPSSTQHHPHSTTLLSLRPVVTQHKACTQLAALPCLLMSQDGTGEASTSGGMSDLTLDDLEELGVIGSGSSGVAKKVRHRKTGALLVLKIIQFDVGSDIIRKQVRIEANHHDMPCT